MSCFIEISGKRRSVAVGALREYQVKVRGPIGSYGFRTEALYTFRRGGCLWILWASRDPALLAWWTWEAKEEWDADGPKKYRALNVPMVRLGEIRRFTGNDRWVLNSDSSVWNTRTQAADALLRRFVTKKE